MLIGVSCWAPRPARSKGAALERLLDPGAGRHPVAVLGRVRHRVPVNPGVYRRAEVLTTQLVVHEDLSPVS